MAASVSTNEAATTLRRPTEQTQPTTHGSPRQLAVRNASKRRCVASPKPESTPKLETVSRDAATPVPCATCTTDRKEGEEERELLIAGVMCEVEDEGGGSGEIGSDMARLAAKNEQLHASVASLKRHVVQLEESHCHGLVVGLGTLNAVNQELVVLQKEYQERSVKNAALVNELLGQIATCSAQVDALQKTRRLEATELRTVKQECALEMNRLISRLEDLAESACQEPNANENDGLDTGGSRKESVHHVEHVKEEVGEHKTPVGEDTFVKSSGKDSQQAMTDRINRVLRQLDSLHAEMFQLKQTLVQENQSFRRHLEDHLSRQIARTRELQDNERERIYEEMDEIRSGMCGILKDIHRLKERTKYLVPSMAQAPLLPLEVIGKSSEDRWMSIQTPSCATPMPCERSSCDWVAPSPMEGHHARVYHPHSTKSGTSSPDAPATAQRATQLCESPHYSSRSSSLLGRLSVYGEEPGTPSAEQFDLQLQEQHRLFWIGEGAG